MYCAVDKRDYIGHSVEVTVTCCRGWVGDITCIFFVPMSTIVDHWSMIVPPPVARGAYVTHAPIPPPGGALTLSHWLRALISGGRY